jgi:hypothetical protein
MNEKDCAHLFDALTHMANNLIELKTGLQDAPKPPIKTALTRHESSKIRYLL